MRNHQTCDRQRVELGLLASRSFKRTNFESRGINSNSSSMNNQGYIRIVQIEVPQNKNFICPYTIIDSIKTLRSSGIQPLNLQGDFCKSRGKFTSQRR